MQIQTPRLTLRPWRQEDRAPFFAINSEPEVQRHLLPVTREKSDRMLDKIDAHFARHGFGSWAVEERASGRLIGLCGLLHVDFTDFFTPAVEIGWRLSAAWQGKGLAKEAASAAMDQGFGPLGLDRIVAFTVTGNAPSRGLMERLGMRKIGEFDNPMVPKDDRLCRNVVYEIGKADWRPDR